MLIIPQNIAPPSGITIVIKAPVWAVDLTTVTAVTLGVLRQDGSQATWNATILSATTYELVAQYIPQAGDITTSGAYYVQGQCSVPGGIAPTETIALWVATPWNCNPKLETSCWLATTTTLAAQGAWSTALWRTIVSAQSPFQASPFQPWLNVDLTLGGLGIDLWTPAQGGDIVIVSDLTGKVGVGGTLTITPSAGWEVPTGAPGAYGSSFSSTSAGVVVRWKAQTGSPNRWIAW